jgi:hypothetical protein
MEVEVVELGDRPTTFTKARRFAPAGARVLGESLGQMGFADGAAVVLDWSNELGQMPSEVAKPVLHVRVIKRLPEYTERNVLFVDVRLDIEDIFGGDNMTAESIRDIVQELQEKVEQQVALRKES